MHDRGSGTEGNNFRNGLKIPLLYLDNSIRADEKVFIALEQEVFKTRISFHALQGDCEAGGVQIPKILKVLKMMENYQIDVSRELLLWMFAPEILNYCEIIYILLL